MSTTETLRALVTGSSGFLGSSVLEAFLERHPEWQVSALDVRLPRNFDPRVEHFFQADIADAEGLEHTLNDYHPDLVVHTAGIVPARKLRYSTKESDWQRTKVINVDGTKNVLDWALAANCKLFVYTSSCTAVTDDLDHDYYDIDEDAPLGNAKLHYGRSKGLAEAYVMLPEHEARGLLACALRPSMIIGPRDTAAISVMHDCIARGETKYIVGDGDNLYDFVYIDNVVDAHVLAAENLLTTKTAAGHAFFISNDEPVYFWDLLASVWAQFDHVAPFTVRIPRRLATAAGFLVEWVSWLTGTEATLDRGTVKDGVKSVYANCSKAKRILGYAPRVGLTEGVKRSCEVNVFTVRSQPDADLLQGYKSQLAAKAKQKTVPGHVPRGVQDSPPWNPQGSIANRSQTSI